MNNFISNDSNDFEYLRFDHRRERRKADSTIYYYPLKADGSKGYSCYAVAFSSVITREVREKGFFYLRIRVNKLTSEIYFVFSNEKHDDSLKARNLSSNTSRLCVYSKGLVNYIMKTLGIEKGDRVSSDIETSSNKSRIDDVLVYQVLGAKK